jgi:hypothetical protein
MSRLDSFIRRLEAQRACLDYATAQIAGLSGCVLEFGLGNGRTYDHLRSRCPGRDIYVFERHVAAHPDCIPPADRLYVGDFLDTLPRAAAALAGEGALAHLDTGTGDPAASRALAAKMLPLVLPLLKKNAIVIGDQPIDDPALDVLPLPSGVEPGRYFLRRRR